MGAALIWSQLSMLQLRVHWRVPVGFARDPPSQWIQESSLGSVPVSTWPGHWKQLFTSAAEFFPKNNEEQWFGVGGASDWLGKKMRHKFRPYGPIVVTTKEALSGSLDTHTKQGQKKQEIKKRNYDISRAFHT